MAQITETLREVSLDLIVGHVTDETLVKTAKSLLAAGHDVVDVIVVQDGDLSELLLVADSTVGSEQADIDPLPHGVISKADERRFTLGPWYVPNSKDAHGEWTDPDELQAGLWNYVRNSDRRIRLQHNVDVVAGEWLEALTWPFPVDVEMADPETGKTKKMEFPAGTVFMGVQWEPWAWEMVKAGKIKGYSMGGQGQRVMVDLPEEED
jgi:hypothetical protein